MGFKWVGFIGLMSQLVMTYPILEEGVRTIYVLNKNTKNTREFLVIFRRGPRDWESGINPEIGKLSQQC